MIRIGCILLFFYCLKGLANVVDLTHAFDEKTIYWPTEKGFQKKVVFKGTTSGGYFYSAYKFCMPEHGGTHMDAPVHFSRNGLSVSQIPAKELIGHALVIDLSKKINCKADYRISVFDIQQFEKKYRVIRSGDLVFFYTGWSRFWKNKKMYMGSAQFGDVKHLHFPGISKEAARYLVQKKVRAVGIDTASLDEGQSLDFQAHRILLGANVYGVENLRNLDKLPAMGALVIAAPLKIKGGSGAPVRVLAIFGESLSMI
ncbi:MAG: hypothetical protein QG556_301 [Pseudomonadota bacterium]|nr:hypothetical protein [Pseudomonadota bacterium]